MSATKELQTNFIVDITPWRNIIRKNMSLKMFHWEFCEIFWKSFFKKPPQNNCYWCRENFIFCAVDQDVSYCWQVFDRILVLLGVVLEDSQESTYRGISFQYSCSFTKIKSIEGTYHRLFLKFPYSFFSFLFIIIVLPEKTSRTFWRVRHHFTAAISRKNKYILAELEICMQILMIQMQNFL